MIALSPIPDTIEPGTKLTKRALAARMERSECWVTCQGVKVRSRGETWEASYKNGGRLEHYTLRARLEAGK